MSPVLTVVMTCVAYDVLICSPPQCWKGARSHVAVDHGVLWHTLQVKERQPHGVGKATLRESSTTLQWISLLRTCFALTMPTTRARSTRQSSSRCVVLALASSERGACVGGASDVVGGAGDDVPASDANARAHARTHTHTHTHTHTNSLFCASQWTPQAIRSDTSNTASPFIVCALMFFPTCMMVHTTSRMNRVSHCCERACDNNRNALTDLVHFRFCSTAVSGSRQTLWPSLNPCSASRDLTTRAHSRRLTSGQYEREPNPRTPPSRTATLMPR
jgi:hypothetical protein